MNAQSCQVRRFLFTTILVLAFLTVPASCAGPARQMTASPGDLKLIQLPPPRTEGGKPLMQALKDRHSSRSFREEVLTPEVLSNLLWAAYGINRPESGKRTAPSALNWQEIDIYVTLKEGLYLYEAKGHALVPILNRDIRAETGSFIQPFVKNAPLNLVYVADLARTMGLKGTLVSAEEKMLYAAVSTGAIVQDVYLYCASEGLSTVVRGYVDKTELARVMGLREDQKIILAQTVGYPE
jgi:SagB-type dehydrogenase family enzyme